MVCGTIWSQNIAFSLVFKAKMVFRRGVRQRRLPPNGPQRNRQDPYSHQAVWGMMVRHQLVKEVVKVQVYDQIHPGRSCSRFLKLVFQLQILVHIILVQDPMQIAIQEVIFSRQLN